jgi:hypothetical protein
MTSPVLIIMGGIFALLLVAGALILRWLGQSKYHEDTPRDYERRRLHFAAVVLTSLAIVFIIAMSMYYFAGDDGQRGVGKEIFTTCVTIIPPIVTLVLGYYFGKAETRRKVRTRDAEGSEPTEKD